MILSRGWKKTLRGVSDILKMDPVDSGDLLKFDFQEFRFFWNSENGGAIFFGNPQLLKPLIAIPYMLLAEFYNTGRRKRYFVKLRDQVAAIFALRAKDDSLIVSALAVSPDYRRLGIGLFILERAEKLCKQMKIKWLQLSVLKSNTPAQRLYQKFGFKIYAEGRISLKLRKRIPT
jgi:GNAT superfamily N-acetyltransferase